jgi:hypothetical protein
MPRKEKVGNLEIEQDLDFQQKEWQFERWGWILMAAAVLAGLLGLFGQGPISNTVGENGPIQVQYEQFERLLAPAQYKIQIGPEGIQNGEAHLHVDQSLIDAYTVQSIVPQPDRVELSPDHQTYIFPVPQADKAVAIDFYLQSNRLGAVIGNIGVENGQMVPLSQFIYP